MVDFIRSILNALPRNATIEPAAQPESPAADAPDGQLPTPEPEPAVAALAPASGDGKSTTLCVILGLICLAFPFITRLDDTLSLNRYVEIMSYAMAFGLFLTAVGGYATGKWRGWTFGGAAATVVALFLVIMFFGRSGDTAQYVLELKIASKELFKDFQQVEVFEENGTRLFVAPDRRLHHLRVLIEPHNLETECLVFLFLPKLPEGASDADSEPIVVRLPRLLLEHEFEQARQKGTSRRQFSYFFHQRSESFLKKPLQDSETPVPVTSPDECNRFQGQTASAEGIGEFGSFFAAHAAEPTAEQAIKDLLSDDTFIRRDARSQLASMGPSVLPQLMPSIPAKSDSNFYRYALGSLVAIAGMLESHDPKKVAAPLEQTDIDLIVSLAAHDDKTMRKWATASIVRLEDERSVEPLLKLLADGSASDNGRYNAAFALVEFAPVLAEEQRQKISKAVELVKPTVGPRTQSLISRLEVNGQAAAKPDGWVYLGSRILGSWTKRYFEWEGPDGALPVEGDQIVATGKVNLRAERIRFTLDKGWQNSPAVGLISPGDSVKVKRVVPVVPGFYWAEITQ